MAQRATTEKAGATTEKTGAETPAVATPPALPSNENVGENGGAVAKTQANNLPLPSFTTGDAGASELVANHSPGIAGGSADRMRQAFQAILPH